MNVKNVDCKLSLYVGDVQNVVYEGPGTRLRDISTNLDDIITPIAIFRAEFYRNNNVEALPDYVNYDIDSNVYVLDQKGPLVLEVKKHENF